MPYNVSCRRDGARRVIFCRTGAQAAAVVRSCNAEGAEDVRVVSVEGVVIPQARLAMIERLERFSSYPPSHPAQIQPKERQASVSRR